ncbi:DUF1631 family protein [Zhongshania guokunii]|uniref:DUF1631 family protein n=1 Tax=Zhongshania guokunii TaxID=641783 RepID=A0ABV3U718_9GAMM
MPHSDTGPLLDRLKSQARQWFGEHLYRYFDRLQDNFHRRALTASSTAEQDELLKQQRAVKAGQDEAFRLFADHINQAFIAKRSLETGSYPELDRLALQLEKLPDAPFGKEKTELHYFCRAIAPITLLAGFQHIIVPLRLDDQHRHQALTMFQGLFIQELSKLYEQLFDALPKPIPAHNLGDWIAHSKLQLSEKNLSTQQRALTELRLQRLLKLYDHRQNSSAVPTIEPTDGELIEAAASIFHGLSNRRRLSPSILASLNTLQNKVSSIALQDRQSFLHALHPARQVCRQIVNALAHWDNADNSQRFQFEGALKIISRKLAKDGVQANDFTQIRSQVDDCCQHLLQSIKLNDKRNLSAEVGQKRLTRLRRKVHEMLDEKTAAIQLPAGVDNMLYGPMTTIVLYHWLRHGSNSTPLRRSMKLIDDILWYIKPHADWSELRRAKAMSKDLEAELSEGLARINYSYQASQALIDELHQLRMIASGRSTSLKRP